MRSVVRIALCAAALSLSASVASAYPTVASPGKNVAAATFTGVNIANSVTPSGTVQILKGKKKHLVKVEVTMVEASNTALVLAGYVTINGVQIDPGGLQLTEGCTVNYVNCTVQGTFWADIDALELANPGAFVKMPLDITFSGVKATSPTSSTVTATVSIFAQQLRK